MRYSIRTFATALLDSLEGKTLEQQRATLKRLVAVLTKKGMRRQLHAILRETERLYLKAHRITKVEAVSPTPLGAEAKQDIERALGTKMFFTEQTDPSVIAGVKLFIDEELLIDATAQRQLEEIFNPTAPQPR